MELAHPSPKQKYALEMISKYKFLLYGGAMYGGKSYLIRWALVGLLIWAFKKYKIKGIRAGLFCEDYPALKDRHLTKISTEFPEWLGTRHSDHKDHGNCFILGSEYGGGVLAFRNLDDPSKYDSAEFAFIGVDELTKNQEDVFKVLRRRLRWPGIDKVKFIGGTNPGGIGHAWVKKLWMDKEFDVNEVEEKQFFYVPAKYTDNPIKNPSYEATLNSMEPKLRDAFRDGNWDMFEGQYFTEWVREYNVEKPFKIPDTWLRFMWMDYGYRAPSAVYWAALDEYGRLHVYRELYETGLTYRKLAKKIYAMTPPEERDALALNQVADPAIFSKKGEDDTEKSGAEQMYEETNGWLNWRRGNNNRIIGWGVMRDYMRAFSFEDDGKKIATSKLIFFEGVCKAAIRTIPALVHDSVKVEDVDTGGEDHSGDAVRYGIMDVFDMFSEKVEQPKAKRDTRDIFEADMKAMKEQKEEDDNNVDWMNI